MLRMPFTSDEAKKLNQEIFETLYFAAVTASMEMAKEEGPYSTFEGSPMSQGEFQHNMWGMKDEELSGRWDWASYTRRVLSGEFIVVNKHLLEDLVKLGLWNEDLKQEIMRHNGSVQNIDKIPQDLKDLYKTVWEMSMKDIIDMSRQRGYFIDQSQSLNLFMQDANYSKLTSMHFYAWQSGLKTGMYYLRTKAAVDAIKFTLNNDKKEETAPSLVQETEAISVEDYKAMLLKAQAAGPEDCEMCGS